MNFYEKFKLLCAEKGKSEVQIAQECGLSKATPSLWKKGSKPSNQSLKKVAEYFNVSVNYLLNNETPSNSGISRKEMEIICKYRQETDMQKAIDRLLNMEKFE